MFRSIAPASLGKKLDVNPDAVASCLTSHLANTKESAYVIRSCAD
jgi:hypothetical protein